MQIAGDGAVVDVASSCVPTLNPEPLRRLHSSMLQTFQKHAFRLWGKRQVFLLPRNSVTHEVLYFSSLHWTPKPGKPEGRFLGDLSNSASGSTVNSDEARAAIVARFGEAPLPSISDIVDNIFRVAADVGGLDGVSLWTEDVVGALGQFNISPESTRLLAFPVDEEMVLVYFTGLFGWMGAPFVFRVLSRAFGRAVSRLIKGVVSIYVDDIMGMSPVGTAAEDQAAAQGVIRAIFGPESVNLSKSEPPVASAEFLGWHIHLPSASIRPSDRGIRKLAFAFLGVDISPGASITLTAF
jgi:hypothetical protein